MKIIKDFVLREIAGEFILVPVGKTTLTFNGMITLSETAGFIWKNLEKATSLDNLVEMIRSEYDIDNDTASADAQEFIGQLLANEMIAFTDKNKKW